MELLAVSFRTMNQFANVKDFGAIGDGTHDDTLAFQTAVNSISPYGSLLVPEGTYRISNTITFPSAQGYNGITFFGTGFGSIIKPTSNVKLLFDLVGENLSIKDLAFDGSNTTDAIAIRIGGSNGTINNGFIEIEHCQFTVWKTAIQTTTDSWTVKSCYFIDANKGVHCLNNALNSSVNDCYFLGGEVSVHLARETQQPEGMRIYDNTMLNTKENAKSVLIEAGLEIHVFNNIIDQTGKNGWATYIKPSAGSAIVNVKITNNWLDSGIHGGSLSADSVTGLWIESNSLNCASGDAVGFSLSNINTYWVKNNFWLNSFSVPSSLSNNYNGNVTGNAYAPAQNTTPLELNEFRNPLNVPGGMILTSPNGNRYALSVNNWGRLYTQKLP